MSAGNPSDEYVRALTDGIQRQWESKSRIPEGRTLLDRGFDLLLTPNYAVAGAVDGMIRDDKTVWQGFTGGLRAGLDVFGNGYEKGETTFSDVLESAGWKPESTFGKFAKGATGFVLDVALDPTTYLTGGASALVKGTGRTGKVADDLHKLANSNTVKNHILSKQYDDTIQNLINKGVSPERAEKFAYTKFWQGAGKSIDNTTHMTDEMAEAIILKQSAERGVKLTPEQLADDARKFSSKYNELQGIRDIDGGKPITWGLANFPFMEKNKTAQKFTWELSDGKMVRELSDKLGISNQYQKLRANIYGRKMGELFSTTAPLWRLAQEDPAKLYDFVKFMDYTKGLSKGKIEAEKLIRDKAKAMNFTPSEQKEILELLQNKTVWGKVRDNLKFAETSKGKEIADAMRQSITKTQEQVDELLANRRTVQQMLDAVEGDMIGGFKQLEDLSLDHQDTLSKLNLDLIKDKTKLTQVTEAMREEVARIDKTVKELEHTNGLPIDDMLKMFDETLDEQKQADEYFGTIRNLEEKKGQAVANRKTQTEQLKEQGVKFDGDSVESELDALIKGYDDEMTSLKMNKPAMQKRQALADKMSEALYGVTGKLPSSLKGENLKKLVDMFAEGKSAREVREFVEENAHLYSNHATEVYKFLAKKFNYKSWKETYHEPMEVLKAKLADGQDLSPWEFQEYLQLEHLRAQRSKEFKKLFSHMSYDEFKDYRTKVANNEMMADLFENVNKRLKPHEQLELTDYDRALMSTDDFQTQRVSAPVIPNKVGEKVWGGVKYEVYDVNTKIPLANGERMVTKKRYVHPQTGEVFRLEKGNLVKTQESLPRNSAQSGEFVPKSKEEIINDKSYATMHADAIRHYVNAQSKNAGRNLHDMTDVLVRGGVKEQIENVTKAMGDLLTQNFKGKAYDDLTRGQQTYLYSMAMKRVKDPFIADKELAKMQELAVREAERRAGMERIEAIKDTVREGYTVSFHDGKRARAGTVKAIEETQEGVKYKVEVRGEEFELIPNQIKTVSINKKVFTSDQLIMKSDVTQTFLKEKDELVEKLTQYETKISDIDTEMILREKALIKEYKGRVKEQKKVLSDLEETKKMLEGTLHAIDNDTKMDELIGKITSYEKALADDDAFEMYFRMTRGDNYVDGVLKHENITNSARYMFHNRASSEKIAKQVEILYDEFKKIGASEVAIGKLNMEQFQAMLGRYVPHILTEDGRRYFDELKELEPHKSSLTQDLGYGVKYNPYAKSRTIEGKTIEEINEYFRDKLQGKNLFSENVADIYLIRALKNSELMYDHEYMNTMMNTFGKDIVGDVEDGYKAVANYGQLRKKISEIVRVEAQQAKARGVSIDATWFDNATLDVLRKLDLPDNILDDLAIPMIELNESQVAKLNPLGVAKQVNDAIVMKANQARKLSMAKDESRFLQMYDKFLHFMKLNQTTVMPAFHIRNKMSNMYLNWLGVGRDAVNPRMQKDAWKTVHHSGDVEKLKDMKPLVSDDGTKVWHWNELYELAKTHSVIDEGFFAKDIGAGSATKGLMSKKVKPKYDPTNTENFILYKEGAKWGTRIENSDRLIHFASLLKQGKSIEEAGESSRKFLFDYSDLTAFEQSVMKRIFPYYTWLRKNGRLQVSQTIEQPGKYRDTAKALNALEGGVNEEDKVQDRYLSDFAKDWTQTPFSVFNDKGEKEPIMLNPNLPFMDLGRLPDPSQPLSSARELFAQTSPQLKVPIELMSNTNFFFNSPIVEEGDNQITPRLAHIMRQLALFNAGEGFITKEGVDFGLHGLNTFGGVKGLSYDYETSKNMKIAEYLEKLKAQGQ